MDFIDAKGRPEPPTDGDELATVVGFLDFQRATLEWKIRGLDEAGFTTPTAASSMTLKGMLSHLTGVEAYWFPQAIGGEPRPEEWIAKDALDMDWDWKPTAPADEVIADWRASIVRSREVLAAALTRGGLDQPSHQDWGEGRSPSIRWILVHMVEEYSRHNGHADLLREAIDGETGE